MAVAVRLSANQPLSCLHSPRRRSDGHVLCQLIGDSVYKIEHPCMECIQFRWQDQDSTDQGCSSRITVVSAVGMGHEGGKGIFSGYSMDELVKI